jgi:hypothetical protein
MWSPGVEVRWSWWTLLTRRLPSYRAELCAPKWVELYTWERMNKELNFLHNKTKNAFANCGYSCGVRLSAFVYGQWREIAHFTLTRIFVRRTWVRFQVLASYFLVFHSSGLGNREYGRRDPSRWQRGTLYPQKLALTSPTSGGRSVGIILSWTQTMELVFLSSIAPIQTLGPIQPIYWVQGFLYLGV